MKNAVTPLVLTPFVPFRLLLAEHVQPAFVDEALEAGQECGRAGLELRVQLVVAEEVDVP